VGSGVRASELCGLALLAPDGLSDLDLDSLERGRVELRVRWDGGAKDRKSRRVPITPKLAASIKRYEARERPAGKGGRRVCRLEIGRFGDGDLSMVRRGLPTRVLSGSSARADAPGLAAAGAAPTGGLESDGGLPG
jgi:integrase